MKYADTDGLSEAEVLPPDLLSNVEEKTGKVAEKLLEYIKWLKNGVKLWGAL